MAAPDVDFITQRSPEYPPEALEDVDEAGIPYSQYPSIPAGASPQEEAALIDWAGSKGYDVSHITKAPESKGPAPTEKIETGRAQKVRKTNRYMMEAQKLINELVGTKVVNPTGYVGDKATYKWIKEIQKSHPFKFNNYKSLLRGLQSIPKAVTRRPAYTEEDKQVALTPSSLVDKAREHQGKSPMSDAPITPSYLQEKAREHKQESSQVAKREAPGRQVPA